MGQKILKQEIAFVSKGAVCLNAAAYCISIAFFGVTLSFAVGLFLGTAVLILRLHLLYRSVWCAAKQTLQGDMYNRKRHMAYYLLRMLVFAAAFGAAYLLAPIAALGTAIPTLYPRLLYTVGSLFSDAVPYTKRGESRSQ